MEQTPEFQFAYKADGYLRTAEIVINSDDGGSRRVFRAPILHLIAHGLELLFKHVILKTGKTEKDVRKYDHNLLELWNDGALIDIRKESYMHAENAWIHAQKYDDYEGGFEGDAKSNLDENIRCLSRLHTKESNFALRYLVEPDEKGPIPLLLIETFLPVTDASIIRLSRGE